MSKDKKTGKKRRNVVDKLVMGGIIGGAIGSVIGMSVAPKTGKNTRRYIRSKGKEFINEYGEDIEGFKKKAKKRGSKVWRFIKKRFSK